MRVFQPRNQLRFDFEAANELRLIGVFRQDDLDGDIATNRGLIGAIDYTEPPCTDALTQLVALDRATIELVQREPPGRWCVRVFLIGVCDHCSEVRWNGRRLAQGFRGF